MAAGMGRGMDSLTFVSRLIEAIAWPVFAVVAVLLLRKPIVKLLPTLQRAKYKDWELEFGEKLEEAENKADQVQLPHSELSPGEESRPEKTLRYRVEQLASVSARAAVAEAWREVEESLLEAAERAGVKPRRPVHRTATDLLQLGQLQPEAISLLEDLRVLRNRAVHAAEDFDINPRQALEYGLLAERLIASIRGVRP